MVRLRHHFDKKRTHNRIECAQNPFRCDLAHKIALTFMQPSRNQKKIASCKHALRLNWNWIFVEPTSPPQSLHLQQQEQCPKAVPDPFPELSNSPLIPTISFIRSGSSYSLDSSDVYSRGTKHTPKKRAIESSSPPSDASSQAEVSALVFQSDYWSIWSDPNSRILRRLLYYVSRLNEMVRVEHKIQVNDPICKRP